MDVYPPSADDRHGAEIAPSIISDAAPTSGWAESFGAYCISTQATLWRCSATGSSLDAECMWAESLNPSRGPVAQAFLRRAETTPPRPHFGDLDGWFVVVDASLAVRVRVHLVPERVVPVLPIGSRGHPNRNFAQILSRKYTAETGFY
ncbi:hypothetical protein ANO11243_017700 [Dothideomycetidae sp. 11243]|nr:hypothetical protein ANO11243_017700 [fungal sp. No.11243]